MIIIKEALVSWINENIDKKTQELQRLLFLRQSLEKEGDLNKEIKDFINT